MKYFIPVLLLILFTACSQQQPATPEVVATNAWTAAFAIAAGAENVEVLAPYEMQHPADYELRPGDIQRVMTSKLFVYAGYEVMANQVISALNLSENRTLKIQTDYSLQAIDSSVLRIAYYLGTQEKAEKNLTAIKQLFSNAGDSIRFRGLDTIPVLVQYFQVPFARELGMNIAGVFGPAPPEPGELLLLTKTGARLILDNAHSPSGEALKETMKGVDYRLLVNFPGSNGMITLEDVIRNNVKVILQD
jgi:zinc transport system substrate-binding protein